MPHEAELIATLAVCLTLALVLGLLAHRLRMPTIVGYLLAGILVGPHAPGFALDPALASELAEIGVILMMFGVGLHFSPAELLSVRRIALPGAVLQIVVATLMGGGLARWWGWTWGASLVFGLALSVASTVVLMRALQQRGVLKSINGRIAVGWLIVEDMTMVLALVLLPPLAVFLGGAAGEPAAAPLPMLLVYTLAKVAAFVALMFVAGRRLLPGLLAYVARTGSRELFTLSVVVVAVGIAFGSAQGFGVSMALGAFIAGMVLRGSRLSHRATEDSLPLRDAFSVLFFVSVGMLFDPTVLVREPVAVLAVLAVVLVGKSLAAFLLVVAFRYPLNTALTVSASLAQIGEFSFILGGLGVSLGVLPPAGMSLILAAALISIAVNHLLFRSIEPLQRRILAISPLARMLEQVEDPLAELPEGELAEAPTGRVLLAGYGGLGSRVGEDLLAHGVPLIVIDINREIVARLRARGIHAVAGDAAMRDTLVGAHGAQVESVVVAIPDPLQAQNLIVAIRELNPNVRLLMLARSAAAAALYASKGVESVFEAEVEVARTISAAVRAPHA